MSTPATDIAAPLDRLSDMLDRFRVRASLFHAGPLCGLHVFDARPGRAFMHVLRRGTLEIRHPKGLAIAPTVHLSEPTLLLYPRPLHHEFLNPPVDGSDFACATLDFEGGGQHPIVQSLPAFMAIPLAAIDGLEASLDLLFSEADQVRCGFRPLADRLFEVVLIKLLRWIVDHPADAGVREGVMMGLSDPRLARSLVALHRAPEATWSVERMADIAGMSRSAFAATFRMVTGTTPAAYLLDWRVSMAATLLRAGCAAKQVAIDVGFADSATLSKAFRKRMGVSPRQWATEATASGQPPPVHPES
ncbi:AraC family transcriptional regulator [Luteibacter aegosomaticola]|uniref:AraC family transcriptional regulator n=1 Tax=Luteibacter aegosomaticola TaxID=2911538 RepID=UPI001FFAD98F|nr:AraC family transcriptional regulator [Luteibacter aegosomaticola]UPG90388.1 AraC family transcriptional regulator [Luteibacter aegosomaticola]